MLTHAETGKSIAFNLFQDKDIGFGETWILDTQIEARHDDDVDTDEDVHERAQMKVKSDLKITERKLRK